MEWCNVSKVGYDACPVPLSSHREDVRGRGGKVGHSLNVGIRLGDVWGP